ncbi:hypothetical protein CFOL_v3_20341 [Cephalotus follicularis]|uniref:Uncharacterized protein n=1 Tax=Cephalotus follicularis TaxID=3775 RepID=A0A1Q3C9U3_CEPFO|nr:hypothetical protein CFOL_v3_20341 [Cephalotus follicularis]
MKYNRFLHLSGFSFLLVPIPNSSLGSSQCLALFVLHGCNINKIRKSSPPRTWQSHYQ